VKEGKISEDTLKAVSRQLLPLDMYVQAVNQKIEEVLKEL